MTALLTPPAVLRKPPDHTQLPEEDGTIVTNFLEHPQSVLLTDSLGPVLAQRHPDEQYAIGQDCGIYWEWTDPPLEGCKAPDWFYVPGVPPLLDGEVRRSYVLWQEVIAPLTVLEFASGDGAEELDRTPRRGKFWVYEQAVRAPYYGIFIAQTGELQMYRLLDGSYVRMEPNERGHYPIAPLGVELGLWRGRYQNVETLWLRWFDAQGRLLPTGTERAEQERLEKEAAQRREGEARQREEEARQREGEARQREEQERQQKEEALRELAQLKERLRQLGVDPGNV